VIILVEKIAEEMIVMFNHVLTEVPRQVCQYTSNQTIFFMSTRAAVSIIKF
jgi:hypothetical protein